MWPPLPDGRVCMLAAATAVIHNGNRCAMRAQFYPIVNMELFNPEKKPEVGDRHFMYMEYTNNVCPPLCMFVIFAPRVPPGAGHILNRHHFVLVFT
jgi:hypothetical protein